MSSIISGSALKHIRLATQAATEFAAHLPINEASSCSSGYVLCFQHGLVNFCNYHQHLQESLLARCLLRTHPQ